jgi:hypothetical protein
VVSEGDPRQFREGFLRLGVLGLAHLRACQRSVARSDLTEARETPVRLAQRVVSSTLSTTVSQDGPGRPLYAPRTCIHPVNQVLRRLRFLRATRTLLSGTLLCMRGRRL